MTNSECRKVNPAALLPVGFDDFGKVIEKRINFVDKTLFIKEVLDNKTTEVTVITRPRRFGKTFNLSMLYYFLSPEVLGKSTKGLFDGLKIVACGDDYMRHQGQYPVVSLTFKEIKESSFENAQLGFLKLMSDLYGKYDYLLNSDRMTEFEKDTFRSVVRKQADAAVLKDSIKDLMKYLYAHHGIKPWLLIDEYDTPIQSAYVNKYYDEMVDFLRGLLSAALKNNAYLDRAVITGILRVAKESLFSGLNNVEIFTLLRHDFSEHFGFTENEVQAVLKQADLSDKIDEVKEWYNGYRFGETIIYNPWSIANYLKNNGEAKAYWVNTSDNQLIKDLLKQSKLDFKQAFEVLVTGKAVEKLIDEHVVFKYLNNDPYAAWSLLLMSGYLKPISRTLNDRGVSCNLAIPNREVRNLYQQIIEQWLYNGYGAQWYVEFLDNLLNGHIDAFKQDLEKIMQQIVSYHDLAKEPEAFFHGLLLGFTVSLHPTYEIKSNRESGLGRFDIMLIPQDKTRLGIIIELKVRQKKQTLIAAAKEALAQIDKKNYAAELAQKNIHQIIKIGIGFENKEFALCYKA